MAHPLDQQAADIRRRQNSAIEVHSLDDHWLTGTYLEGTTTLDLDPQTGLDDGHIWVRSDDGRGAPVSAIVGDRFMAFKRTAGKRVQVGITVRTGERIAYAPVNDGVSAAANAQIIAASSRGDPVNASAVSGGRVYPTDDGGLQVFVDAYPPVGWQGGVVAVDSADLPTGTGEFGWLQFYFNAYAGVPLTPQYLGTTARILPTVDDFAASAAGDARDLALPLGAIRLQAITVYTGQTDILNSNSRVLEIRHWLTPDVDDVVQRIVTDADFNVVVDADGLVVVDAG